MFYKSFLIVFIFSLLFFFIYKKFPDNLKLLDKNNLGLGFEKTPTSSGLIFFITFLIFIYFFKNESKYFYMVLNKYDFILVLLGVLTLINFIDDIKSLNPILRLFFQIIIIYFSLIIILNDEMIFSFSIYILINLIIWVYIINIANFTDGADGFLATNTLFFYIGILCLSNITEIKTISFYFSFFFIPLMISFLIFNRPIASIYMGDVGSNFIGFFLGLSFLELAYSGYWNISLSLVSYTILDCSITLIKRIKKKQLPWIGRSDYFFSMPLLNNKINQFFIFKTNFLFNLLNLIIVIIQIIYDVKALFVLNIILSLVFIKIYKNKTN